MVAKLPNPPDPTLAAADAALVAAAKTRYSNSLGAGWVGMPCERAAWYKLRHCRMPVFDAAALKRFDDGHHSEDVAISRIRMVPGIEWHSHDPETGKQYGYEKPFQKGFYDGVVRGLIQSPKKWHVGEIKCSEDWQGLEKAAVKMGPKNALMEWNMVYYGQAQKYMHEEGLDRHYLVAVSPGGRKWTSARTEYNVTFALQQEAKIDRIIYSEEAPSKIADSPTSFSCKFCDFASVCHGTELPDRDCRTCINVTPDRNLGAWVCALGRQLVTCDQHRFNPSMLKREQIDVQNGSIVYADGYVDAGPDQV